MMARATKIDPVAQLNGLASERAEMERRGNAASTEQRASLDRLRALEARARTQAAVVLRGGDRGALDDIERQVGEEKAIHEDAQRQVQAAAEAREQVQREIIAVLEEHRDVFEDLAIAASEDCELRRRRAIAELELLDQAYVLARRRWALIHRRGDAHFPTLELDGVLFALRRHCETPARPTTGSLPVERSELDGNFDRDGFEILDYPAAG